MTPRKAGAKVDLIGPRRQLVVVWPCLAILVGWVADRRGQSGLGWFVLALLTSPLVAGLLLVLLTPRPGARR